MSKIQSLIYKIRHSVTISTPAAIILGALLLSVSHIAYGFITSGQKAPSVAYFSGRNVDSADFVEGSKDEDVYVVEYSDPECPFCVTYYPTLKKIREEYKNSAAFVYRHFPLTDIHPHAFDESKAIACAGTLGGAAKFYEYMDRLYAYKSEKGQTTLPSNGIEEIAKGVGLDTASFASCMKNEAASDTVNASMSDGVQAGVEGTPTTFVLKKTRKGFEVVTAIVGARDYAYTKAAIEQALSR